MAFAVHALPPFKISCYTTDNKLTRPMLNRMRHCKSLYLAEFESFCKFSILFYCSLLILNVVGILLWNVNFCWRLKHNKLEFVKFKTLKIIVGWLIIIIVCMLKKLNFQCYCFFQINKHHVIHFQNMNFRKIHK